MLILLLLSSMRTTPFHSLLRGLALGDVWHDNDECPLARSIARPDRRQGVPLTFKQCNYCALLNQKLILRSQFRPEL